VSQENDKRKKLEKVLIKGAAAKIVVVNEKLNN